MVVSTFSCMPYADDENTVFLLFACSPLMRPSSGKSATFSAAARFIR